MFDIDAESRARGVLTFVAALMSPVIGASAIFDTTRALSTFTYARCSAQGRRAVHLASTTPLPFPESLLPPIMTASAENGHLRGALVTNLFIVPVGAIVLTVALGIYTSRGKPPLPATGPPPSGRFVCLLGLWDTLCDWMYYGSTTTTIVVILALGWDGSVAAIFSIFGTTIESGDTAGDVVLALVYFCVVVAYLIRIARSLYLSSPTRFFATPGSIRKKEGKAPLRPMPAWAAAALAPGHWFGRFVVVGDWVWRPGSLRSFPQLRECASLFRRFHGPRDEDRAAMAAEFAATMAAAQGVTPVALLRQQGVAAPANAAAATAAARRPSQQAEATASTAATTATAATAAAAKETPLDMAVVTRYFRRVVLLDFLFVEFFFVFFIALFRGLARVSADPASCEGLAMASAVFNLLFFTLVLVVRPFIVPARNVFAVCSAGCAMIANFLTATGGDMEAAAGLATFGAVLPILCMLLCGVPRLLMRFVWALQHAPGRGPTLRDPTQAPPQAARATKAEGEVPLLAGAEGGSGGTAAAAPPTPAPGPLTRLAHIFFPPPPDVPTYADNVDNLCDSFGDDDDDADEDLYLSKCLGGSDRYSVGSAASGGGGGGGRGGGGSPREAELREAQQRVDSLHRQIAEVEAGGSPHRGYTPPTPGAGRQQFTFAGVSAAALFMSPANATPQQRQQQQQQRGGGGGGDGTPQANPRIAQELALAQLLYSICQTRQKATAL